MATTAQVTSPAALPLRHPQELGGRINLGSDIAHYRNLSPRGAAAAPPPALPSLNTSPDSDAALEPLLAALIRRGDSPHTRRAYARDLATFATWLTTENFTWEVVTSDDLDRYREHLAGHYARATVNRGLVVVRLLYGEAKHRHLLAGDPADRLRGIRGRDDRDGGALTRQQARDTLEAVAGDLQRPGQAGNPSARP
jgi:hypothetical protein